jgi:hypothetical protein
MDAVVTLLRRKGVRLTRSDLASAECYYGDLSVHDIRDSALTRRAKRVAELVPPSLRERKNGNAPPPLFDPVLVRMKRDCFVLVGFEVHTLYDRRGSVVEYVQSWLVQTRGSQEDDLPPD